tara:strand:- start:4201 stop:4941 length:741 start_codon:yes stop_codon:yes gene_type:complete
MYQLEGVYWDLDGTIANTELEAHLPAFNKAFDELGINWYWEKYTYIDLLKINGGKNRIAHFSKLNGDNFQDSLVFQIHRKKQENYMNLIEDGKVKLNKGVFRLITELMSNNIRQFIVTSSSKAQVQLLIKKLFVDFNPFEFYVTSEDVDLVKPSPMPYLRAMDLSGIKNFNSLVFEDSIPGLKASTASNLRTICVKSNIPINFDNEKIECLIDTFGDKTIKTRIIKGPKIVTDFITLDYLVNFLNL